MNDCTGGQRKKEREEKKRCGQGIRRRERGAHSGGQAVVAGSRLERGKVCKKCTTASFFLFHIMFSFLAVIPQCSQALDTIPQQVYVRSLVPLIH